MPATACCSLSRSSPGPWPGHYSFTLIFLVVTFVHLLHKYNVHCIFNVAGHWAP